MKYTVKKLAALSGVSVRTLHFYDEIGLLKPATVAANGYRYYGSEELLRLQQILFYRELGFELKQIDELLAQPEFDRLTALESHRHKLQTRLRRTGELIATIGDTIQHLKGSKTMKSKELFRGFDPKAQARHEQYLIHRYGDGMKDEITRSKARVKDWSPARWDQVKADSASIGAALLDAKRRGLAVEGREVQQIIRRHFDWICQFWTPNRNSYAGFAELIVSSELREPYSAGDPELPEFTAAAIKVFASEELE